MLVIGLVALAAVLAVCVVYLAATVIRDIRRGP